MDVCCKYCVLSGRGLCDGLITRPGESYRLWLCVIKKPRKRGGQSPLPGYENTITMGCNARKTNKHYVLGEENVNTKSLVKFELCFICLVHWITCYFWRRGPPRCLRICNLHWQFKIAFMKKLRAYSTQGMPAIIRSRISVFLFPVQKYKIKMYIN